MELRRESPARGRRQGARGSGFRVRAGPLIGIVGMLCGCAAEPPDRSLPFRFPARFTDASVRAPEPVLDRWWTRFRSAELTRLVALADERNFDIVAAAARLAQAEAQARVVAASLFPQVNLFADAQRSQSSGTNFPGVILSPTRRTSLGAVVSASYILDIWGQLQDTARAARLLAEATDYEREVVRLATQAAVVNAYLQYAAILDQLRIANENVRNAERILAVVRERLAAGTGSALDVAQQETLVANQRATIPTFRLALANARSTLAILVGRPPQGFDVASQGVATIAAPRVSPGVPAALLARRPDIRRAEAQLASAEANVDAARKALLPSITLTGQGGFQSAAMSTLLRPESALYSLAAGLAQPIFEGGRLRAQIDLSDAQRQELLEVYRKTIVVALTDVENALNAIRESERRNAALRVAVEKANTAFRLSEDRLREGTIDLVILLATQQALFQAQDALNQNSLIRLQAAASLFQALGGDWLDHPARFPQTRAPVGAMMRASKAPTLAVSRADVAE